MAVSCTDLAVVCRGGPQRHTGPRLARSGTAGRGRGAVRRLALGYHLCEQRGEAGREAMKKLQIAALAVAILVAAAALISVLR